jgi:hypothetical protein
MRGCRFCVRLHGRWHARLQPRRSGLVGCVAAVELGERGVDSGSDVRRFGDAENDDLGDGRWQLIVGLDELGDTFTDRAGVVVNCGSFGHDDHQTLRRPGLLGNGVEDLGKTAERIPTDQQDRRYPGRHSPAARRHSGVGVNRQHCVGRRERRRHEAGYVGSTR